MTTADALLFDDLYVISDLHMGGAAGLQIFQSGELLAATIDHLTESSPRSSVGLVINGDSVDFIAEPNAVYFDPTGSSAKLERIVNDTAFKPVWDALARFVHKKRRTLFFNLGNHDLELALPAVRELLTELLAQGDDAARGRIHLGFDGAGISCRVGSARVLCLHGNEVDTWNICDYEELRRQSRDLNLKIDRDAWTPNAGTKMVIDVMNQIKRRFPFVDLLKPEVEAVIPTLYALDPGMKPKLSSVLGVVGRLTRDKFRRATGFLEATGEPEQSPVAQRQQLDRLLSDTFTGTKLTQPDIEDDTGRLLLETERRFRNRENPQDLSDVGFETLGIRDAIKDFFRGKERHEVLREALQGLADDTSFNIDHHDSTYTEIDKLVGREIDFLITGHTHQRRAIPRPNGGFYYNSGTWVRLIQLTPAVLKDEGKFRKYFQAFTKGTMAALDAEEGMILNRPTVVAIRSASDGVAGMLCDPVSTAGGIKLQAVSDSKFVKR